MNGWWWYWKLSGPRVAGHRRRPSGAVRPRAHRRYHVPRDVRRAQPVADVGVLGVIDERDLGAATERRRRGLDGVDREVATGRRRSRPTEAVGTLLGELAVDDRTGGLVEGVGVVGHAVAVDDRVLAPPSAPPDRVERRTRRDEPLVVEERAAERPLEEVVGQDVVRSARRVQVRVDRQLLGRVLTHRQADRVGPGDVAVGLAAVDLVLVLVEPVDQVGCAAARQARTVEDAVRGIDTGSGTRRVSRLDVVVDGEGVVAERARDELPVRGVGAGRGQRRRRGQVDVVLQEAAVCRAVLGDLRDAPAAVDGRPFTAPHSP